LFSNAKDTKEKTDKDEKEDKEESGVVARSAVTKVRLLFPPFSSFWLLVSYLLFASPPSFSVNR
jgi:hypothetical protein